MTSPDTEFISILETAGSSEPPSRISSRSLPDVLPVLGLSDVVIFPGAVAPLLVETGPSVKLIDDVVAGDRLMGAVLQRKAEVADPGPEDVHEVGCVVRLAKMVKFPDSTARVLVEGLWRIRIKEFTTTAPYLCAKYELMRDLTESSIELTAMLRNAQTQFQEIIKLSPALSEQVKVAALNTEDPGHFSDLIAANLNLSLEERQKLLETPSVRERLSILLPMLNREQEVLTLSSKIQSDVASSIAKTQRDFFLREQMRAIQRELGEAEPGMGEASSLREKIEQTPLPAEARKAALQELERLQQTPPAAAEYAVSRNYLDWILSLPWEKETEDKLDLARAERILNEQHFGLTKVKDRLIEFLAILKRRKQIKGPILCLVGPPGVGKTSLGKSVADALGRKFARISLGGMRDEAEIRGHRRTYVGSLPGRIIQTLRRVESRNPAILLDELDKVGADFRGDPAAALLEVLDPAQNNTFTDHYLDLPFDLSRVLFLTTANWLEPIHPALRDRLEVIELPSYTESEKLQIARRYLVPRQIEEHGLKRQEVTLPDATIRRLIQEYTREAGVRQLEREIAALARKAARKLSSNGQVKSVKIEPGALKNYLGHAPFVAESAEKISEYGIATGMAWTPTGGEILLHVEVTRMPGRGSLLLTGSLGEVMKESAQTAVSYLRGQARALKLNFSDYNKYDIHIHVPAGATPKDGPSAGVVIVAALASLLAQRRVRSDMAMTGEISLRGRVLRIGGVKEKVLAAIRFGLKHIVLPDQNRPDWLEMPAEARKKITVHFVSHISQVVKLALEPKMKGAAALFMAGCFAVTACASATTNELSVAEIAGRQLARQLIEGYPAENSTLTGVLRIRAKGVRSEIPARIGAVTGGARWQAIYETLPGTNGPATVKLVITHDGTNANRYELDGKSIAPEDAAVSFAGTDFWLADLGLEFFHWPEQRVVKKEFRRNCACTVLESVNPALKPGSYTRVVTWIDQESGGIVHAVAYDGKRELKLFDPRDFKKVNGQWQLHEMQIENVRTDSRTRLEFNLKSK